MSEDRIKQAEEELLDALNQPYSYETDGEKITLIDPEKRMNVIDRVKKNRIRNPFAALKVTRISTQGTER